MARAVAASELEPCGIYHIPPDQGRQAGKVNHVVARTAGAHRKYFYRRYENGCWTPWEQIKLDIEDNPVIPAVWNDRLFLFWLRIVKRVPDTVQKPFNKEDSLTNLSTSNINTEPPNVMVEAVLCWSEYYNRKWQPTRTSDVSRPARLGLFAPAGAGAFDHSNLWLFVREEDGALRVGVGGQGGAAFVLYNTHSLPVVHNGPTVGYMFERSRGMSTGSDTLDIFYNLGDAHFDASGFTPPTILVRHVLRNDLDDRGVTPQHQLKDPWVAPFFYEDGRHVFYITTSDPQPVWVADYRKYGVLPDPRLTELANIPPLVLQLDPKVQAKASSWDEAGPMGANVGVTDPALVRRFVTEDAYIHKGIGAIGGLAYGGRQIGPSGAISNGRAGV